jgi:hypothetical protein
MLADDNITLSADILVLSADNTLLLNMLSAFSAVQV